MEPKRALPQLSTAVAAGVLSFSLLLLLQVVAAAGKGIGHLPGFGGALPFYLETGYVEVDGINGVELFYYFIESERDPATDPLLLWITGGPGCSALSGLLFEIGPLKIDVAGYTQGLPTLLYFKDSWTQASNVIFLDAPVGTGFSYSKLAEGYNTSDTKSASQILVFLRKWLANHPEFILNPLYIGGDSYSGMTVPISAWEIHQANKAGDGLLLNLKGYLVGNPATDTRYDNGGQVPFMHGMALIPDELFESAKQSCGGNFAVATNAECQNDLDTINYIVRDINQADILERFCGFASRKHDNFASSAARRLTEGKHLSLPVECRDNGYKLSYVWANDAAVRSVLGIHEGSIGSWSRCSSLPHYNKNIKSSIAYHLNLTTSGYRALVYNGDHDMAMTFVGTQAWIRSLGFSIANEWRPWYVNSQVAGFTRTYANNLTYATVKGAGHTAPEYKPKECLAMVGRWLHELPL